MAAIKDWLDYCARLYAKGVDLFDAANPPVTEVGPREPSVVALTLLARTLSHMRATVLLVENDQIVEARTISRAAYENMFWAAALLRQGADFVTAIEQDDITSRKKRSAELLDWAHAQKRSEDYLSALGAFRESLIQEHGKTSGIVFDQAATAGGVRDGYVIYRELSSDAAHPTAESLSRYVTLSDDKEGDGPPFTLHAEPPIDPLEQIDTLELLCTAVLTVIVAVNELLGGVDAGERLDDLAESGRQLGAENRRSRDEEAD